jgi:hypothetical protein
MILREHHHPGRVAQLMSVLARRRDFAHAVVNDQPAMPGQDGRSACPDFQPCPGSDGRGQPVMRIKQAEVPWFGPSGGIGQ